MADIGKNVQFMRIIYKIKLFIEHIKKENESDLKMSLQKLIRKFCGDSKNLLAKTECNYRI